MDSTYRESFHRRSTTGGFTLIELLVVIAIISILSSVVLASLNSARSKARDAKRMEDLHQIQLALAMYADKNDGKYPSTGFGRYANWRAKNCTIGGADQHFDNTGGSNAWIPDLAPEFISVLPNDPKPGGDYQCYIYTSDGIDYALFAFNTPENYGPPNQNILPPPPIAFRYPDGRYDIFTIFAIYSPGAAAKLW